jgi:hypothetical protein
VLKFSPKTVEIFLDTIFNISTSQQIPPPHRAENNRLVIGGGDIAAVGGDIPLQYLH